MIRGHAFIQNLRRGHSELGVEAISKRVRVDAAFDELAQAIGHHGHIVIVRSAPSPTQQSPCKSRRPGASRRTNQTGDRFQRLRMARARSGRSV